MSKNKSLILDTDSTNEDCVSNNFKLYNQDIKVEDSKDIDIKEDRYKTNFRFNIKNIVEEKYYKRLLRNYHTHGAVMIHNFQGIAPEDLAIVSNVREKVVCYLTEKTVHTNIIPVLIFPIIRNEEIGVGINNNLKSGIVDFQYEVINFKY